MSDTSDMPEQTKNLITHLVEAWNSHDPERVGAYYTEDCYGMDVAIARPQVGRAGVERMFAAYYHAFPDLEITPDDIIVADDHVALFWTARGTHSGPILNIPPSGRPVTARGVNRLVLHEGKVCETLTIWDVAGMLRGLGLLPDL
jgi:steroid delta-isomerase-like uncharacterized protein